jgi:hypothetical protein
MADPPPAPNESDTPKDEYPLAQAKDTPGGEGRLLPPLPEPQVPEIDTGHKERYQFTLSELLWLMVGVSLFLSALSSAGSFLPGGDDARAAGRLYGPDSVCCHVDPGPVSHAASDHSGRLAGARGFVPGDMRSVAVWQAISQTKKADYPQIFADLARQKVDHELHE